MQNENFEFAYKVCQNSWTATDVPDMQGTNDEGTCSGSHMAYLGEKDGSNYNCMETYDYPTFLPIENTEADAVNKYKGFTIKYTANDDSETHPRTVTIDAYCNKGADGVFEDISAAGESGDVQYKFTGDEACKFYDVDISKYFSGLAKFIGVLSVALGLVMTFYGSKFLVIVFGILILLLTQVIAWGILYNTHMFKPDEVEEKKGLIIGLGIVVLGLGGVAAYYAARFADKFAVPLISGWVGGIFAFMIIGATGLPGGAKMLIVAAFAAASGYYSYKVQRYVKSAGTAIIGAFILFNGIGKFVGGYPEMMSDHAAGADTAAMDDAIAQMDDKEKGMAAFYLVGTVAFGVLGTWFQLTYVQKVEEEEGDFMK